MAGELVVSTINGAGFDIANVIYNPEFTINQRGAASRTAATGYNFDRWYYDGTRLLQGVEGNNLRAGTYVLSWSGSSTAEFSLNTAAASGQGSESYTAVTNGGTITIASVGSNNLWVRFSSDLTNLTRVKLSLGTEASGFVARPYGTELALCQRYFEKSYDIGTAPNTTTVVGQFNSGGVQGATTTSEVNGGSIIFAVQKRATPSITLFDGNGNSGKVNRVQYGVTNNFNSTGGAAAIGQTTFTVDSASGATASGVICHWTASAEL
jgi:hypothetical protein